jgi:integrase/recombinase XerD
MQTTRNTTKKEIHYSGPLASILQEFVDEKQAVGYKYQKQARDLLRFNRFCISQNYKNPGLTKEIVHQWTQKQPNETVSNQANRISLLRNLGLHMARNDRDAYVYPVGIDAIRIESYIPYIFSYQEIADIFKQVDSCQPHIVSPNRHRILPLLFRLLYGCGLRISEALQLQLKDVLIEKGNGILRILGAKFGKDRLVPMCSSLTKRVTEYRNKVLLFSEPDDFFFPSPYGGKFDEKTIYDHFRQFLWKAGISHGGTGKGPRLHDIRHTFAVHCLKRWVLDGVDLSAALPYLSVYLGHTGLKSTQHYLRLTAELYPEIVSAVEKKFGELVPDGDYHETN